MFLSLLDAFSPYDQKIFQSVPVIQSSASVIYSADAGALAIYSDARFKPIKLDN